MAGMAVRRKEWQNSRMAGMATYVLFTVDTHRRQQHGRRTLIFYSIDDNHLRSSKSFEEDLNWREDLTILSTTN